MATKKEELNIKDTEEIKKELTEYLIERVDKEAEVSIKRAEKKLLRGKTTAVIKRDILIIILVIVIVLGMYYLYKDNYFDKYFVSETYTASNIVTTDDETDYKEMYGYLVDNYVLSDTSLYLEEFYNGNLTNQIKLAMSAYKLDIVSTNGIYVINSDDIKLVYNELFGEDYVEEDFSYGGASFIYVDTLNAYISYDTVEEQNYNILKYVFYVSAEDNILVTTIEGNVSEDKIYNILTKKNVGQYESLESLLDYQKKLNTLIYTFTKAGDKYILSEVEVME